MEQHLAGDATGWYLSGTGNGAWAPQPGNHDLGFGAGADHGNVFSGSELPQGQSTAGIDTSLFPVSYGESNEAVWPNQAQGPAVSYVQQSAIPQQPFINHQVDGGLIAEAPNGYHHHPHHWAHGPQAIQDPVQFDNPLAPPAQFAIDPHISNQGPGFLPDRGPGVASQIRPETGFQQPVFASSQQSQQPQFPVTLPQQAQPSGQPVIQQPVQQPVQQAVQHPVQHPVQQPVRQPVQQPVRQPVQQSVQHSLQPQQPPRQPIQQPIQPQFHQLPQPHPQNIQSKEPQATQKPAQHEAASQPAFVPGSPASVNVSKKARVIAPAVPASQPPQGQASSAEPADPVCTIYHQETALLESAKGHPERMWEGVPNLVLGDAPTKLQKSPPIKRYVPIKTKGERGPLFPQMWRGWTTAEAVGNHEAARKAATNDIDIRRADIRLEIELKRANPDMPAEVCRKLLRDSGAKEGWSLQEPVEAEVLAGELIRRHPAHRDNQLLSNVAWGEYLDLLKTLTQQLRDIQKKGSEQEAASLEMAKKRLTAAIVAGIRADAADLFPNLQSMGRLKAMFKNIFVSLINAGEITSPLVKALLELFVMAKFISEDLEFLDWMDKVRKKVVEKGDEEARALITRIYEHAPKREENGTGKRQGDAASAASNKARKTSAAKTNPDAAKTTSTTTPPNPANDATTTATSTASKTMPPKASDKTSSKPATKVAGAAAGAKRPREADTGAESRSSKKPAMDTSSASKASSSVGAKAPASKPSTASSTATTSSSSNSTAPQTKSRTSLLLPGKTRPATKPAAKSEPVKADEKGTSGKTEPASKASAGATKSTSSATTSNASKVTKPKSEASKSAAGPSKSRISALIETIEEEKQIRTPEGPRQKEQTPAAPETPEERERRLRKEARRHLRVTFKSGDALVEVREFTRHPEEIAEANKARLGRELYRTMNSEESEMMKRLHREKTMLNDDFEEREWDTPSAIDFTGLSPQVRERTYVTRGGIKTFETEEQKRTQERESRELMVIYHSKEDIPPSPRSPPPEPSSGEVHPRNVYLNPQVPDCRELFARLDDFRKWGAYHAARAALHRKNNPPPQWQQPSKEYAKPVPAEPRQWYDSAAAAKRDQATLELLTSDSLKHWEDPDPNNLRFRRLPDGEFSQDERLQVILYNLKVIALQVQNNPCQPVGQQTAPAAPVPNSGQQQTVSQPPAVAALPAQTASPDYAAAWAQYYAAQQQQNQQYQTQQQYQAQPAQQPNWYGQQSQQQAQQQPAPGTDQIAGILAALGIQQASGQPAPQAPADPNQQVEMVLKAFQAANPNQAVDPQQIQHLLGLAGNAAGAQQPQQPPSQYGYQHPYYNQHSSAQQGGYNPSGATQGYGAPPPPEQHTGYGGPAHGYGQSHQERETYGQMYNDRERGWERENGRDAHGAGDRDQQQQGRDRDYHRDRGHRNRGSGGNGGRGDNAGSGQKGGAGNQNPVGTKPCLFWAKGKCAKGDKCTFRHD